MIKDEEVFKGSRKKAVEAGYMYYFTGKPCPKGHLVPRHTEKCACTTCHPERSKPAGHTGRKNSKKRNKEVIKKEKMELQERRVAREFDRNSYKKALGCGDETYPRATPCAYCGGKLFRTTIKKCVDCGPKLSAKYREANREAINAHAKVYNRVNRDKRRADSAERYWKNRDHYTKYSAEYRAKIKADGDLLERSRSRSRKITKQRVERMETPCNRYLSHLVDEKKSEAASLREVTGLDWCIDHVVPVMHDKVCGLNTGDNLRIIRGVDNRAKNNLFFPHWENHGTGVTTVLEGYIKEKYQAMMEAGHHVTGVCPDCGE